MQLLQKHPHEGKPDADSKISNPAKDASAAVVMRSKRSGCVRTDHGNGGGSLIQGLPADSITASIPPAPITTMKATAKSNPQQTTVGKNTAIAARPLPMP